MKKRKAWKTDSTKSSKQKMFERIVSDPQSFKRMMDLQKSTSELIEKSSTVKSITLEDWKIRVVELLPENIDKNKFSNDLNKLIEEYTKNESQNEQ